LFVMLDGTSVAGRSSMRLRSMAWLGLSVLGAGLGCTSEPGQGEEESRPRTEDDEGGDAETPSAAADASVGATLSVPDSWTEVKGPCGVALTGPGLMAFAAQGTDSCIGHFLSEECRYSLDLGGFSNSLSSFPDAEEILVEGKPARLVHSRSNGEGGYFAGVHVRLWGAIGFPGTSITLTAECDSEAAQATALQVLRTLNPPDDPQARAAPFVPAPSCTENDQRPILGYALGRGCSSDKLAVPGVCAVGAKANNAIGTGAMLCFVDAWGGYYWAFVAFGESVEGRGAKHGRGELWGDQLSGEQAAQCQSSIDSFMTATPSSSERSFGEYVARPCTSWAL
jgi:hypothetical protein